MKRLIVLLVVGLTLIAINVGYTAAPTLGTDIFFAIADVTVSRQLSNSDATMAVLTNENAITMDDSAYIVATLTGIAVMDPYDKLYIGFRDAGTNDSVVLDTFLVQPPYGANGTARIPFMIRYIDSLISQSDATVTLSVNAACGGSSGGEAVQLENLIFTMQIMNIDGH